MMFECDGKRVLICPLMSIRFLLFLSILPFNAFGQSTDTTKISGKLRTEYFDIFRQRSDRLSTTIFASSFDATISVSRGCDTLALGYSGWNQYASYNNLISNIESAAENGLRSFSLQWTSSTILYDYSGTVLFPISHTFLPVRSFGGWVRLKPFGRALTGTFSYEEMPASFTSGLGLEDFLVQLNEENNISDWNIMLQSRPYECIEGMLTWGKTSTVINMKNEGYSSQLNWGVETLSAQLKIYLNTRSSFWFGCEKTEDKGNAVLSEDDLMFGYLTAGNLNFNKWLTGGRTTIFSLPVSCEYSYCRWEGSGVGEIESWPFTPIAATVFANRLYYEVSGNINLHQIESSTSIETGSLNIEPALGLYYILADISLKHWEPQYLVFLPNINTEPFSIERSLLLRLGCRIDFPLFGANVAIQMEQFIPLSIKYHHEQEIAGVPSSSTISENPSSTDGGRRIRLEVFFP
jgi:hypothetical protein